VIRPFVCRLDSATRLYASRSNTKNCALSALESARHADHASSSLFIALPMFALISQQ